MTDESIYVVKELLNIGGTAGVLYVAIWFLVKTLKSQYENRIVILEKRSDVCEEDRRQMNLRIHEIQTQRVAALEKMLEEKFRVMTE